MISGRNQAIVDVISANGGVVDWTNQELADYLGLSCSVTRMSVAIRQLVDAGVLVVERTDPHPKLNKSGRRLRIRKASF